MLEKFDHNFCFLSIGSYSHEYFSVLGFTTFQFTLSQNYKVTVTFRVNQPVSLSKCLHQPVRLSWHQQFLHGIVTHAEDGQVVFESPLYSLSQTKHSRIYADKNFPELIQAVLSDYSWQIKKDFDFLLKVQYPVSKYTAQYQETHLEFIQRQCSRWGINFCFIQHEAKAILTFFDENNVINERFSEAELNWLGLSQYQIHRKLLPKKVNINDYNPDTPELDLSMEIESKSVGSQTDNRLYEFYQTRELGKIILKRRLEYYDCLREYIFLQTDYLNLQLGQKILLQNNYFYITELNFKIDILGSSHHANATLIGINKNYRPALPILFRMPYVTAHVISEHVDEAGRYYISPDYDENYTQNTYPVRLAQPCAGNNIGFHFPLVKHSQVVITHINGDPDRPVILGVMPSEIKPHPVTGANNSQHVLRTPHDNQWLMDDSENTNNMQFTTQNNKAELNLRSDIMEVKTMGHILFEAKELFQTVQDNYFHASHESYMVNIGKNYTVVTEKGDIAVSSGKNFELSARQVEFVSDKNLNIQSKNIQWRCDNITFQSSKILLSAKNIMVLKSSQLNINSMAKIILTVGSSSLRISRDGITFNSPFVKFNTPSFISSPPQLAASNGESANALFKNSQLMLQYKNLEERFSSYMIKNKHNIIWSGSVREKNNFNNLEFSEPVEIHHADLPVIGVEGKAQKPSNIAHFQPQQKKLHEITLLSKPKYKVISQSRGLFQCELLSEEELNYFKNQTNNKIIIFVHGYNVPAGHFGKYSYLRTPEEGFTDDSVNGSGAPNWLMHMEYNLNCAIQNTYLEFPWDKKALDYRRILGIHWPGYKKIYDIPWSNNLNFSGMEFNALASGYALSPLIKQLHRAGIEITLIAHSLGNLVAVQLMDLLGREHQTFIDHVFLWQAAIAKTALSPCPIDSLEQKQKAVKQSMVGSVMAVGAPPLILYEYYGEFLRQKAAQFKNIPPWALYEKDPFAYFPYAHYAAKKLHVLFSENDDVLKWLYRVNEIFANLPHYNFIFNPLGLYGPDEETLKLLKSKLQCVDQSDCLFGHSDMKIPIKTLFEKIYTLIIKESGYE
ncbi:MAG: contractile injection system protein, VgrG/Pvc8 family [Gammaproteobacteria bacterium]|nr:contractile injection system protein, VgrG/Pvc8 family [Gammaproteobacteria bacterium]